MNINMYFLHLSLLSPTYPPPTRKFNKTNRNILLRARYKSESNLVVLFNTNVEPCIKVVTKFSLHER